MYRRDHGPTIWGHRTRQMQTPPRSDRTRYRNVTSPICPLLCGMGPATSRDMLLETVFEYRTLIGKCDLACGLEWHEIDEMERIEQAFRSDRGDGRRFRRQPVDLTAIMRGDQINDRVTIVEMAPGGVICLFAPYVARNEQVEIVIDDNTGYSYRFSAKGVWLKDAGDDYRVGLQFVGMPVRLHTVQISARRHDIVDKIVSAAA